MLKRPHSALATLTVLLVLLPAVCGQVIAEGPELEAAKRLIVMIEGRIDGREVQGAGIVFAVENGWTYVATAYHLVRPNEKHATDLKLRFLHLPRESFAGDHYVGAKQEFDVAVIRARIPKAEFDWTRVADPRQLKKSDPVYAIGYPLGGGQWVVNYKGEAIGEIGFLRLRVQSPMISTGYSGGALIDSRKRVLGMIQQTNGSTAEVLRIDHLAEILERDLELPVQLARPASTPSEFSGSDSMPLTAGTTRFHPVDELTYVWIPPGEFIMGCSQSDTECKSDERQRRVEITAGFWIGQTEVTNDAYSKVMAQRPAGPLNEPFTGSDWYGARAYCRAIGMRLPTEVEWEYAARAGTTSPRYGDPDLVKFLTSEAGRRMHGVKASKANPWGLYGMLGNVQEWTDDYYDEGSSNPEDPGRTRVVRGGSAGYDLNQLRVSARSYQGATLGGGAGFRCVGDVRFSSR